ncbi:MAG TPA: hypothetical protein DGT21_17680 [Armatimonadetes bacterium]|jgi:lipopolysaccharide export system permease protein|nr:hypothetical protein [Armatimonadota bacterium]
MSRLDRYISSGFAPLLLGGMAAFLVVLVGVDILPRAIRWVIDDGVPVSIAAQVFFLKLPSIVPLTMPMAVMFASLMVVATLSSHGELLALRAAGISMTRVAAPVVVMGFVVSLIAFAFYEGISPRASQRAFVLLREYQEKQSAIDDLVFAIPPKGTPRYWVRMGRFDPKSLEGEDVLVQVFGVDGRLEQTFQAVSARWDGEQLALRAPRQVLLTDQGQRTLTSASAEVFIGKSADQLPEIKQNPQELSIAQLKRLLGQYRRMGLPYNPDQLQLLQLIQNRLALPWCALGFALLGVSLGQARIRASAGVGFGLSLIIVFVYYLLFNTLTLVGARGALTPALTAWSPNVALFAASVMLLVWRKD